jgi:PD-(D/E)XK nuclease superfamily
MNTPFLERIYRKYETTDVSEHCFVFPTRRAGYVFREQFVKHQQNVVWLPEILGIRDFILKLSPLPVADDIVLLLKLYAILIQHGMNETMEKFMPWGKILLNDFNEIDQHLVNAAQLYRQSYEEREIDQAFALDQEEVQEITGFWNLFSKMPLSTLQENFLASWKMLPEVYAAFNASLLNEKITYEGRAYKTVADAILGKSISLPWKKIVFCGFYALSHAEQVIIEALQEQGIAEIYWDVDDYYYGNKNHEAGLYLRRNPLLNKEFSWKESYFKNIPKDIYITGIPLQTGQVKWVSELLSDKLKDPVFNPEKCVIVLPDEKMLPALLYSLPEELKAINVTMGYPAKNSIAASLITAYLELHLKVVSESDEIYYSRNLIKELFIKIKTEEDLFSIGKLLNNDTNPIIAASVALKEAGSFAYLLSPVNTGDEIKKNLTRLLRFYKEKLKDQHAVELAVCNHMLDELDHLFSLLAVTEEKLSIPLILNLIEEHLQTLKIPFAGEPVRGIQVMGFLETRTLDFEHVFILSVNENLLPASTSGKTYLPYSLRKAYKLPLRTEQDAVYSYHFYRLLQRASQIHLIYNTEPKSLAGGEMSRYLLQISMELTEEQGFPVTIHHESVTTDALIKTIPAISIVKDADVQERLKKLYIEKTSGKGLSVTAISDYAHCPLRFYFKYIAKLRVPDEEPEELDAALFGKVFHSSISNIYEDRKTISPGDSKALLAMIEPSLKKAVLSEYKKEIRNGHDYLLKSVLGELLERVVKNDLSESPLDIEGHELDYEAVLNVATAGEVKLYGKIDRIDFQNEILRIIDYKTGGDKVNDKFEIFTQPKKKVMLQLFFYSWLVKQNKPEAVIKAGMYKLREISQGIIWLNKGDVLSNTLLDEFRNELQQVISSIFDPEIPFMQTEDIKRCEYCDFINLCGRNS